MRDCKILLGLPQNHNVDGNCPRTASSQILRGVIIKEMKNAQNRSALNRRYTIMSTNLRSMFEREELSGPSYSRLKILLRGEYENRWNALRKEG